MRQGQATIGQRLAQARLHEYAVVFVLLAMALYLSATTENFLTFLNLSNVLQQVSTIGIIAVGMTVLLVTGNFDLSIGGIAANRSSCQRARHSRRGGMSPPLET